MSDAELITEGRRLLSDPDGTGYELEAWLIQHAARLLTLAEQGEWLRLVLKAIHPPDVMTEPAIALYPAEGVVTIEGDPDSWSDESVDLVCQFDADGIPVETPELRTALESALAGEGRDA